MTAAGGFVYLDFAATTPVDPLAAAAVAEVLSSPADFGNPSSLHIAGRRSARRVAIAAEQLAALLNTVPERLVWTSGATESNNLAIVGAARARAADGRHLITMPTEHKAVTDVFRALELQGFEVSWLMPGSDGRLDIEDLAAAIRDDTQLVSIMHVNNETGVIQDIEAIGSLCRDRDVLYHVDAAQSVGKLPLDLATLPVDLLSTSAHKLYGPKGIGALYVDGRPGGHVEPLMHGGSQQRSLRPGTLPVPLIAGFGVAAEVAASRLVADLGRLAGLRDRLWSGIASVAGIRLNGSLERGFPGILNVSVADVEGESLLLALEPLCVATGSACNALHQEPSAVLRALGCSDAEAQGAIRFSLGRGTTAADVDFAAGHYRGAVGRLRTIAPGRAA
jgi:cysteine desulfurase